MRKKIWHLEALYIANLDCHELRVASLAALAPPIIVLVHP